MDRLPLAEALAGGGVSSLNAFIAATKLLSQGMQPALRSASLFVSTGLGTALCLLSS